MPLIRLNDQTFINPGMIGVLHFTEARDDKEFKWTLTIKDFRQHVVFSLEKTAQLDDREAIASTRAHLSSVVNALAADGQPSRAI